MHGARQMEGQMNANQIINMVMRLFLRKAINKGIDAGFGMAARRKGQGESDPEAARMQEQAGRDNAKRAKQAMRVTRRMGRF